MAFSRVLILIRYKGGMPVPDFGILNGMMKTGRNGFQFSEMQIMEFQKIESDLQAESLKTLTVLIDYGYPFSAEAKYNSLMLVNLFRQL